MSVLVGDVGGTNVRFARADLAGDSIKVSGFAKLRGDDFCCFERALEKYCAETETCTGGAAVFALAGPLRDGKVHLTNRDWTVSKADLKGEFTLADVHLINDFAAMARAVPELGTKTMQVIKTGQADPKRPIIVAGPGTGLGVATLFPDPKGRWNVISGEGGHLAFAPRNDLEIELLKALQAERGYVSNELVCSGMGLPAVHRALCAIHGIEYVETPPADMLSAADRGNTFFLELCRLRARAVMSAVGDLALANGALGGVVLAGGVTERLLPYLLENDAQQRFTERGPMSGYLATCPIHLMTDPAAPLIGAAALYLKDRA